MFEQSLLATENRSKMTWALFASLTLQVTMIGILILIPLWFTQALPKQELVAFLLAPPPPPPPAPSPVAAKVQPRVVKHRVSEISEGRLIAPRVIPKRVVMLKEEVLPPPVPTAGVVGGVPGGVPGGMMGGVIGGIISSTRVAVPAPPPRPAPAPPPRKAEPPRRIRVGGQVQQAKIIEQPMPVYPKIAKGARIQGSVQLEAVIAQDGTIEQLRVITGHPLLVQAALTAVSHWRYRPTYLNGQATEVSTTITVNFTLG
jgi:protein TonB